MYDPAPRRGPLTRDERWVFGIFLAVLLGLFAAEVWHDYQPVKLAALLVVLFWIPLLALHEAGHAVAATLLNWYVGEVIIGAGRVLARFRAGTAVVEIRVFPVEGFVRCVPRNLHRPHLKSALIYFAGPGVELLLAALVLLVVGPDRLLTRSDDYLLIALQSLAVAATVQGVLNLIPHSIRTREGEIANDGLGIIRSFLLPESHYARMIGQTYNERERHWESDDPADWWKRNG
jgi:hypothetical protein